MRFGKLGVDRGELEIVNLIDDVGEVVSVEPVRLDHRR